MRNAEHTLKLRTIVEAPGMATVVRRARYLMGTLWTIEAEAADRAATHRAANRAFDEVARIERWASRFLPTSDVSRINTAAGGEAVTCEPELIALLERCRHYTRLTEGAFDVTVGGALADDEGHKTQDTRHKTVEPDRRRWVAGAAIGSQFLELDTARCRVRLTQPGMALDLGGVAKGYAVDRAVAVLCDHDVIAGAVNAGGNVRLFGARMARSVAIRDPREPSRTLRRLTVSEAAVATSGNYERVVQGMRGHLVDPAAATAAATDALSATVVADVAETADAYSTALFVMGPTRGAAWAQRHGVRAIIVSTEPVWWHRRRIAVTEIGAPTRSLLQWGLSPQGTDPIGKLEVNREARVGGIDVSTRIGRVGVER